MAGSGSKKKFVQVHQERNYKNESEAKEEVFEEMVGNKNNKKKDKLTFRK